MSTISLRLGACTLGTPVSHLNLSLVPLLAEPAQGPLPYALLDDALASGWAKVTEVSESGSVPELALLNEGALPVLLLDGEELVGARQNRILNLSVLAPAHRETTIPVSCVEMGRWSSVSEEVEIAARTHFASGRARKSADVTASLRHEGHRRGDQHEVWRGIAEKSARMRVHSETSAVGALYESRREALEGCVSAFDAQPGQCGAVFAIDGRPAGIELFDRAETFAKALPKLVRGYALDALDSLEARTAVGEPVVRFDVAAFLARIAAAAATSHAAVGEGEDWRLDDDAVTGGALVHDGRVVHLCAFPLEPAGAEAPSRTALRAGSRSRGVRA